MRVLACIAIPALLIAGCAVGPDFERPDTTVPAAYIGAEGEAGAVSNLPWWELFRDPILVELIDAALENNRDLQIAMGRVAEARARLGIVRGDQWPVLGVSGTFERGNTAEATTPNAGISQGVFAGLSAAYEVDLWGQYRRASEAERAALLASVDNQTAVLITLIADVASTYLLLLDLDNQLQISRNTLTARQASTGIIQSRFDEGVVPLLDVNQAQILEADAAVRIASLSRQVRQAENLLSVLLGRNPAPIVRGASGMRSVVTPDIPIGMPADLLERRPDVRSAEQQLAAQTARIGVAQALRFPSISLTGSLGYASNELSDLNDGTRIWGVGVDIFGPLFDGKRRRSQVAQERARTEQAAATYEQTVLNALREVEDALAAVQGYRAELLARQQQVSAAQSAVDLSRARYDGGVTDYLEVLDSDRTLFDAQLAASVVRRQQLTAIVGLYKALGGGWSSDTPRPDMSPSTVSAAPAVPE